MREIRGEMKLYTDAIKNNETINTTVSYITSSFLSKKGESNMNEEFLLPIKQIMSETESVSSGKNTALARKVTHSYIQILNTVSEMPELIAIILDGMAGLHKTFAFQKDCETKYSDYERIQVATVSKFIYDYLSYENSKNEAALDYVNKLTDISSSEMEMLNILSKCVTLRYSEYMRYLEASDYWRSSTTFQREIDHLLENNLINKLPYGNHTVYCLSENGRILLNSSMKSKFYERLTFRLNPLYLSTNFFENKVLILGKQVDCIIMPEDDFLIGMLQEIIEIEKNWDQLFELWLFASEPDINLIIPSSISEKFFNFSLYSSRIVLMQLDRKMKNPFKIQGTSSFLKKKNKHVADLYDNAIATFVGYNLISKYAAENPTSNFILDLFNNCILDDKSGIFISSYSKYGIANLNQARCMVNYCKNIIFSAVYRKLSKFLIKNELINRLSVSVQLAEVIVDKIMKSKEDIFKKIRYD